MQQVSRSLERAEPEERPAVLVQPAEAPSELLAALSSLPEAAQLAPEVLASEALLG